MSSIPRCPGGPSSKAQGANPSRDAGSPDVNVYGGDVAKAFAQQARNGKKERSIGTD